MNSKKAQTIKITPAPIWLSEAVDLYKRMDDAGKGFALWNVSTLTIKTSYTKH